MKELSRVAQIRIDEVGMNLGMIFHMAFVHLFILFPLRLSLAQSSRPRWLDRSKISLFYTLDPSIFEV